MARITIKDIAKRLGINPSTVSRALRNHPDVSEQLRNSIKELSDKLGYKPNHMAINLRKGTSHTIALIIPEIATFFFPSVIKAIEEEAHNRGYNMLMLHSNDSLDREIENAEICAYAGVDGVLVSLTRESKDIEHFSELTQAGIPVVYFDKVLPDTVCHKVVIPGENAVHLALENLLKIALAKNNIVGLFGDERLLITQDRVAGFKHFLQTNQLPLIENQIVYANSIEQAAKQVENFWEKGERPTGLFVMSDELLAGVIQTANKYHINIPNELPTVAISDGFLPTIIPYRIPYVQTSGYLLGKTAALLLFNLIIDMPILPDTHYIDTPFIQN